IPESPFRSGIAATVCEVVIDGSALLLVAIALISILTEFSIVFSVILIPSKELDPTGTSGFINYGSTVLGRI
ncbi:hypothetical protein, partial [Alkalibaculum bacchi]|uniref:hypothetical protein n=1 Tax=Alkalibaculum bacchi TaxID=645887 RepID=UPI0026EE0C6D